MLVLGCVMTRSTTRAVGMLSTSDRGAGCVSAAIQCRSSHTIRNGCACSLAAQALERLEVALVRCRDQASERAIVSEHFSQCQQRRERVLEGLRPRQHLPGHLGAHGAPSCDPPHEGIILSQLDDREVGRWPCHRTRGASSTSQPCRMVGMDDLIDRRDLPPPPLLRQPATTWSVFPASAAGQGPLPDGFTVWLSTNERVQTARHRCLKRRLHGTGPDEFR